MKKYSITKILTFVVLVIAYSIVLYKLFTYNNYNELWIQLKTHSSSNWPYLILTILLVPINLIMESFKWKYAISTIEKVSLKQAIYSTLIGQVGAIATPNKLGDFPTRSLTLSKGNKVKGTILGFISAWTLPLVIIIIGIISSLFYVSYYNSDNISTKYLIAVCIFCVIVVGMLFSIPKITKKLTQSNIVIDKIKNVLSTISQMSTLHLIIITLLSLLRYIVFCTQLYLMLHFMNVNISILQAIICIPTIYLLTTITPSTIASEAATRSSYAILILAPFCTTAPTITIATTLLWCLNNGVPLLIGLSVFNSKKVKF